MTQFVIADTSSLVSLLSKDDSNHTVAVKIGLDIKKNDQAIILPGEIITEFMNVLGKKAGHKIAIKYGKKVLDAQEYKIVETNSEIRRIAYDKFKKQPESVSYTDSLVMAFADEYETKLIFGFDELFRKSGYKRIVIDK